MHHLFLTSFLASLLMFSCKNEEHLVDIDPSLFDCITYESVESWETKKFKIDHTIQLPETFFGGLGFQNTFRAIDTVQGISLDAIFCNGADICYQYGLQLENPGSDSLLSHNSLYAINGDHLLDHRIDFCHINTVKGIFYYRDSFPNFGELYWLTEGVYKQSVFVYFNEGMLDESLKILATIREE